MFYENLLKLCSSHGVKVTNVVTELGCSQGSMSHWKKGGTPNAATLKKFADYFGVSTDDLINGVDSANSTVTASDTEISEEKREMINLILTLPDDKVKALYQIAVQALAL